MDLRLTVTRHGGARADDVTVTASPGHTAAHLLAGLTSCLGGTGSTLTCAGDQLPPDLRVGVSPLLDGACVTIGRTTGPSAVVSAPRAALVLDVVSGPDCGQSLGLTPGRHTIGRDPGCSLVIADRSISRQHAAIEVSPIGVRLTDLGSTNAVRRLGSGAEDRPLGPQDEVQVGDTRLRVRAGVTRPLATTGVGDGTLVVHRCPWVPGPAAGWRFELPARPSPPAPPRVQWLALLLPIPVCAVLAVLWGPQLLAFALLGPLVGGGSAVAERRSARRRYAAELAAYGTACAAVRASADRALAAELAARHRDHPDPAEVARAARDRNRRLWEARAADPPVVRVGLGPVVSRVLVVDPDRAGPSEPLTILEAPVTVDLSETPVLGIVGTPERAAATARCLLAQLVTAHSPDDLVVHAVGEQEGRRPGTGRGDLANGSWSRWLPHLAARSAFLPRPGRAPQATGRVPDEGHEARVWSIAVVSSLDSSTRQEAATMLRQALPGSRRCVLVVCERAEDLPAECTAILNLGADQDRATLALPHVTACRGIVVDGTSSSWAERVARNLAPLRDAGDSDTELPTAVTLATTHPDLVGEGGFAGLVARWAAPPPGLRARIGAGADGPFDLDLVADGPHALVGGTTGAGKSELLRALVSGLGAAYPPEAVTFLLIDYKGGAAFRDCARLPHTVGVVTDLDADLARRALVSLTAEIRRREALLAAVGAASLAEYAHLRGAHDEDLPRLVIVIDEFKLLIEERPDFVDGVVRLAAVGRSLGVHLVLATQRPAGAITADIQANVNLRIALRVRDRQDSEGVIEAPDAALLPESVPGRALVSTGTGRLVAFQTAHVGAPPVLTDPVLRVRRGLGLAPAGVARQAEGPTELAAFVDLAREVAASAGHPPPRAPWLPPLAATVAVADLGSPRGEAAVGIPLGLLDLPERQEQPLWTWSATRPSTLGVVGAPGSGRSTLVRTLVGQLGAHVTPVHTYVVDGGGGLGPLAGLPQVGAVVAVDDRLRLRRLVDRLAEEIRRRTGEIAGRGLTTLAEWRATDPATAPAHLLLVVDGWDILTEPAGGTGPDLDGLALADDLRGLIETGGAAGLCAVLTGGRALLIGRGARLCTETVVLGRLAPTDAALLGVPGRDPEPSDLPAGRGMRLADHAMVQAAHLGDDPSGAAQTLVITALARPARHAATPSGSGSRPFGIGQLPETLATAQLPPGSPFVFAVDADGAPCGLDPTVDGRRLLIAGPRRSGRTSALLTIAERCSSVGRAVVIVSPALRGTTASPSSGTSGVRILGADAVAELVVMRRTHPDLVVLVDDADRLVGAAIEPALLEIVAQLDRDSGVLIAAVEPQGLARLFRGVAVEVASARTGILLSPRSLTDGDAFGVRVPRSTGPVRPGRGHLVSGGAVTDVQLALPRGPDQSPDAGLRSRQPLTVGG